MFMLFLKSDFLFYLHIFALYIGMTVEHRFYKYLARYIVDME